MGHLLAHLTPWLGAAAIGFGVVTAAKGLFGMASEAGQHGAEAAKGAQKAGIVDVRDYQRLSYAAKIAEVDQAALDTGLKRFNRTVYLASKGGKAQAKVLKDLGLNIRGAHKQLVPVPELVARAADRFSKMATGTRKATLAQQAFGLGGLAMIPMLNEGGDAMRAAMKRADALGVVMGPEAAEQAKMFVRSQVDMGVAVEGLKLQLGSALLPALTAATSAVSDYIVAHRPQIVQGFTSVVKALTTALPPVIKNLQPLFKLDWAAFAGTISKAVGAIASFTTAIGGLSTVLDVGVVAMIVRAGAAMAGFGVVVAGALGVAAAPVLGIIAVITAVAAAGYLLVRHWTSIWKWIKDRTYVTEIVKAIVDGFGGLPGRLVSIWNGIAGAFKAGAALAWNAMPDWLKLVLKGAMFTMKLALGFEVPPLPSLPKLPRPLRPSNDNARHSLGRADPSALRDFATARPMSLARGAPMSSRASGAGPGSRSPADNRFSGELRVHLDYGEPPRVTHVKSSTSDFVIHVNRGEAA